MRTFRLLLLSSAILPFLACDGGPGGSQDGHDLRVESHGETTDREGRFSVSLDVGPNADHLQITAVGKHDEWVYVEELWDPDGNRVVFWRDWWNSPRSLSNAIFGDRVAAFDWPSRIEDGSTLKAGTWELVGSMTDADYFYATNAGLEVITATKHDADLKTGDVHVRIVWADGVSSDPAVVDAVEQAVERWRTIWGEAGLTLVERYSESNLAPDLPFAEVGDDPAVERVAEGKDPDEIQLIVGDQIGNRANIYGIAGGIPGSIGVTGSAYVTLSWLTHAGRDARFQDDEIRLMGETMAHECGHFTGLFHPVEGYYDAWDALPDTPECRTRNECERLLGENVMYPFSICSGGTCVLAEDLTPQQAGVMNRYIAAL